jgi:acetolactate synthase-1/2/3 large subunit
LNNAVLGHQQHAEVHQLGAATSVVEFTRIDHAAIAQACGAVGIRITDPNDLGDALAKALIEDRPVVLDILTDPTAFPPFEGWEMDARLTTTSEEDFN